MVARNLLVAGLLILPAFPTRAGPPANKRHLLIHLVRDAEGTRLLRSTWVPSALPHNRGRSVFVDPAVVRGEFHNPEDPSRIDAFRFVRRGPIHYTVRLPAGALGLLDPLRRAPPAPRQATYDVEVLQDTGDPGNRVDILILGDGYRAQDQQKLSDDVARFLQTFWSYTSIGEYQNSFNVKLVHVISNDNGADFGSYGDDRDTALGAYYGCYGLDRLICLDEAALYQIAESHAPEYDSLFVIVNDPKYGGAGGLYSVFSVNDVYGPLGETAVHEYGHTMGGLADEYEDPYPGFPDCPDDCPEPNVTTRNVRDEVKWNAWIRADVPVPTPPLTAYRDRVGVYEGARYHSTGVYRPKQECLMRNFGVGFCEVCSEALVLAFYNLVSLIDDAQPDSPIQLSGCQQVELSVSYPVPQPDMMRFTWKRDGEVLASGPESSHLLQASALGDGTFQVSVEVSDTTDLVRNDPTGLLKAEHTWTVNASGVGQGACLIDGGCYPDQTVNPQNACQICRIAQDDRAWSNDDGKDCDDADPCTAGDLCSSGACAGTPVPECCHDDQECQDGLDCTRDACDAEAHVCLNAVVATRCLIAGVCYQNGEKNPDDACQICNSAVDPNGWSPLGNCQQGCSCAHDRSGGLPFLLLWGVFWLLAWEARRRRQW